MSEEKKTKLEEQDLENPTSEKEEQVSESPKEKEEEEIAPEDLIEKLNDEITDLKDQRLRAIAELENFRKRAEKDQSDALKYGISNFAKEIINIDYTYADRVAINLDFELQDRETFLNKLIGHDNGSCKTQH